MKTNFKIKQLTDEDGSGKDIEFAPIGGREIRNGEKSTRKQDMIFATDDTIYKIVSTEIKKFLEVGNTKINLNHINVSKVTDISYLFECEDEITELDLSEWNVSKVTNMVGAFASMDKLEKIDLSNWNTYSLETCHGMFTDSKKLKTVGDLSNWNILNLKNARKMFYGCSNLSFIGNVYKWIGTQCFTNDDIFKGTNFEFLNQGLKCY